MGIVYIQTVAYNAEHTIRRCVESILKQTYQGNISYHICDNGCTDTTGDILREYAAKDSRIKLYANKINRVWTESGRAYRAVKHEINEDDFYLELDADDAYEPTFLEEMLAFMEQNQLDIAACGTTMLDAKTGEYIFGRVPDKKYIFTSQNMALGYPIYHQHMRTGWGKIYRGYVTRLTMRDKDYSDERKNLNYGGDTAFTFEALRYAKRFGLYPKSLHRYYMSRNSDSYQYFPQRFDSDLYLYNDAVNFLKSYGSISAQNMKFINCVYANAVADTIRVIHKSMLSNQEKLREYERIATNAVTQQAYLYPDDSCKNSRKQLINATLLACKEPYEEECLQKTLQTLLPRCGKTVTKANLPVLLSKPLLNIFINDDSQGLMQVLLKKLPYQIKDMQVLMMEIMRRLAINNKLLCQVDDIAFTVNYREIYWMLWEVHNTEALNRMTALLFDNAVDVSKELFLKLYINLSAIENQIPAYLFGKVQLAKYYMSNGQQEQCLAILDELKEVGMEDNEETLELRSMLKKLSLE